MRRLILPLLALAACQPTQEAPTPEPPPPTTSPAPSTSSTAPATTSTSTSSTTTTVTTVMQAEPAPVVSPQRAADGSGLGTALVSWYGEESGSTTANGEHYDPDGLTFAHRSMPFGTLVEFCRADRCVVARCNDRGPFIAGRTFDLSRATFAAIAPLGAGAVTVSWSQL